MQTWESILTNVLSTFPNTTAKNVSGAGLTDGTEWVKAYIDQIFGFTQALMDYAGGSSNAPTGTPGTPNGVVEAAGVSQLLEAIQTGNGIGPGMLVGWFLASDPSVTGHRVLLMQGQGVLITSYPDLVSATYVGDGNNSTVQAGGGKFYKSSDAAGTTPNTAGPYFQLPEGRGYTLRGLDLAATVDPLGASRFLGDNQADDYNAHTHTFSYRSNGSVNNAAGDAIQTINSVDATVNSVGSPTDSSGGAETRMTNLSIKLGITY